SMAAFEPLGDRRAIAVLLQRQGTGSLVVDDLVLARKQLEESLAMCRVDPNPKLEADIVHKLGWVERGEGNRERALELLEEGARLCGEVGFTWMQASALIDAATLSFDLGLEDATHQRLREALRLYQGLPGRRGTVFALGWFARFAAAEGRPGEAGRLWGAIEAEEGRGLLGNWDNERDEFASAVLSDEPEFEAARAAGRRLSLEEAVELALSVDSLG